ERLQVQRRGAPPPVRRQARGRDRPLPDDERGEVAQRDRRPGRRQTRRTRRQRSRAARGGLIKGTETWHLPPGAAARARAASSPRARTAATRIAGFSAAASSAASPPRTSRKSTTRTSAS